MGGLYSSTATTIILARKSKELQEKNKTIAAITLATSMIYVRLFLLALFFNKTITWLLAPSFAISVVCSSIIVFYFFKFYRNGNNIVETKKNQSHHNPLEFKAALLFGSLFIFFAFITGIVIKNYGAGGINLLSFIVGITDIGPFLINLLQSKWDIENTIIVIAILNAITSNNLFKMIYGISLSDKFIRLPLAIGFGILIVMGLLMSFVFHF